MLSVANKHFMLSGIMLNDIMLSGIMLSDIMLSVIILSVVMMNVVAPHLQHLSDVNVINIVISFSLTHVKIS